LIALDRIRTDSNVRELAAEDVDALAGSIALLGQITPAIVRPDGDRYVLVAGHKRYAALRLLGETEIRAEIGSTEAEHAERAAENLARSQLNPHNRALLRWLHHSAGRMTRSPVGLGRFLAWRPVCRERQYRCYLAGFSDPSGSDATLLQ
jgi:ParB/RepB/Spo0J family partition protein